MTHPAVQRARELADAAREVEDIDAPWTMEVADWSNYPPPSQDRIVIVLDAHRDVICLVEGDPEIGALIAAARTLLPELVEAYEALEGELHTRDDELEFLDTEHDRVVALNTRLTAARGEA